VVRKPAYRAPVSRGREKLPANGGYVLAARRNRFDDGHPSSAGRVSRRLPCAYNGAKRPPPPPPPPPCFPVRWRAVLPGASVASEVARETVDRPEGRCGELDADGCRAGDGSSSIPRARARTGDRSRPGWLRARVSWALRRAVPVVPGPCLCRAPRIILRGSACEFPRFRLSPWWGGGSGNHS